MGAFSAVALATTERPPKCITSEQEPEPAGGRRTPRLSRCAPNITGGNSGLHGMGRKAFERAYRVTELELLAETRAMIGDRG